MSTQRPWLASYPRGVPASIDVDAYRSIAHVLESACERFHHRPAFSNMGKVLTYADIDRQSLAFASYLRNVLKLDKGGKGDGTMAAAARVKPGGETGVRIDDYAEKPVTLTATVRAPK